MKKRIDLLFLMLVVTLSACARFNTERKILSLNGTWEFAESLSFGDIPSEFNRSVPVPGLIDMAGAPAPDRAGHFRDTCPIAAYLYPLIPIYLQVAVMLV